MSYVANIGKLVQPGDSVASMIDFKITGWTDQTIGELARSIAHAVGLGDHVVKTMHTIKTGYMEARVVFDYNPKGLPVALWLETGFKPHKIRGTMTSFYGYDEDLGRITLQYRRKVLHWVDKQTGDDRFATEVNHPGFVGYGIMERAWELGTPILKTLIKEEMERTAF